MKPDTKEMLPEGKRLDEMERLRRELEKIKQETDSIDLQKLELHNKEKREVREHEEQMARIKIEELKSAERIKVERLEERQIVESEVQREISFLTGKREELEKRLQARQQRGKGVLCGAAGVVTVAAGVAYHCGTAFAIGMVAGTALGAAMVVLMAWHYAV